MCSLKFSVLNFVNNQLAFSKIKMLSYSYPQLSGVILYNNRYFVKHCSDIIAASKVSLLVLDYDQYI